MLWFKVHIFYKQMMKVLDIKQFLLGLVVFNDLVLLISIFVVFDTLTLKQLANFVYACSSSSYTH